MSNKLDLLIAEFSKLPGIGEKSAERIAYHLLKRTAEENKILGESVSSIKDVVKKCDSCGNYSETPICEICSDIRRNKNQLCIVEEAKNIKIFERLKVYKGLYHVLGGVISPLHGIGPENLNIDQLIKKLEKDDIKEIIIALNQTTEAELTGLYLHKLLEKYKIKMSRLLSGIPVGSDLEYVDILTLSRSFEGRQNF